MLLNFLLSDQIFLGHHEFQPFIPGGCIGNVVVDFGKSFLEVWVKLGIANEEDVHPIQGLQDLLKSLPEFLDVNFVVLGL